MEEDVAGLRHDMEMELRDVNNDIARLRQDRDTLIETIGEQRDEIADLQQKSAQYEQAVIENHREMNKKLAHMEQALIDFAETLAQTQSQFVHYLRDVAEPLSKAFNEHGHAALEPTEWSTKSSARPIKVS